MSETSIAAALLRVHRQQFAVQLLCF